MPPYSSGPLPTIQTSCSSQPPSLGTTQGNTGLQVVPPQIQQPSIGPCSIVQTIPSSIPPPPSSTSINPGAASLSLHGAGNGSTKSIPRIRNKTRDSPQKAYDAGNFVGRAGPSNYSTSNNGPNRGGVLSNTLPSPRRRKELMKELMQERPSQPPPQNQQQSTESIKMNSNIGAGSNLGMTHGSMPGAAALSGLGAIMDDPPHSSNTSSGPPNQNVSLAQLFVQNYEGVYINNAIYMDW